MFHRDRVSSMMISSPLTPTFGWLSRSTSERWPPKAETPSLSPFFDGSRFGVPSKRTSHGDREPATGRLLWTHGESRCQDLGAPLPYPWRERAKPLEGRVEAAHLDVVGCGLWVVGCGLWVVGCGLCVVGSYVGSRALVSFDTHFVDHPGKRSPLKIMVMKWTPRDFKHWWRFLIHRGSFTRAQQGAEGSGRPSFWGGKMATLNTLVSVENIFFVRNNC